MGIGLDSTPSGNGSGASSDGSCENPRGSLLLDLPVPFRRIDGVLHVESQAHNGIHRWLDNFGRVTICAPRVPDSLIDPSIFWLPVDDLVQRGGLKLHELPWGYHPVAHLRHRAQVRALFRRLIGSHQYLCFSNLGWAGAWGNIAAREAARLHRPYSIWLDWVLHDKPELGGAERSGWHVMHAIRDWLEKRKSISAVRGASLGLFHGQTIYDAYAPISRNPHVVHNIHLSRQDVIAPEALTSRLEQARERVQIGYVGRVHAMKGPLQWIDAMERLSLQHPDGFKATWLGDGPLLAECRRQVVLRGLGDIVFFPGTERNRFKVLGFLQSLDLFAFCHLTSESPRCLIEALMSGVPIVGYDSTYARELVVGAGGGDFVPVGDVRNLANKLANLLAKASVRRAMSTSARTAGERFSDEAVFAHRSELIKRHLAVNSPSPPLASRGRESSARVPARSLRGE